MNSGCLLVRDCHSVTRLRHFLFIIGLMVLLDRDLLFCGVNLIVMSNG